MIKDIVVNLTPGTEDDPACRYAISLAEAFDAHVTGVAFSYDPPWPPAITDLGGADILRSLIEQNRTQAKSTAAQFQAAAKRSQISAHSLTPEGSLSVATEAFANLARAYDLAVLKQSESDDDVTAQNMIEAALFNSGRPVLIVPYIQKAGFSVKRVVVCWDGSRAAARAIGDSLPLIARANNVQVLTVVTGKFDENDVTGADIAEHLARYKLRTELSRLPAPDIDVANAILSHAADIDADLIVMGGYGHSRLRDFVLGGATRSILQSMTVPTFMSH
ncbi:MAG: universal stress protein [Pseudorhodoplanes sp.]|uniref:universal stress protein n=1 Tax=Pseudorhodoplanes sp. TaxID=1934341 RepID=UPI003D0F67F8